MIILAAPSGSSGRQNMGKMTSSVDASKQRRISRRILARAYFIRPVVIETISGRSP